MMDAFVASVTVPGRREAIRPAAACIVAIARTFAIPSANSSLFENAVVEALTNAVEHNPRRQDEPLTCEIELKGGRLAVRVLDEAARAPVALTAPAGVSEIGADTPWQELPESGFGLYLIRAVFPEVQPVTRDGRHGIEMALTF